MSERPKRLCNLSFPIQFDERLPLARSGFRCRKNLNVERIIPRHSVVQLSEHFAQNWSLGFAEETVPKLAMMFKVLLGVVATPYSLGQLIGMVKVSRREVAVGWFMGRRDQGQPQFRNVQEFFRGQWFYDRALVRADNERAFFFQGNESFAAGWASLTGQ